MRAGITRLALLGCVVVTLAVPSVAFAFNEVGLTDYVVAGTCVGCHETWFPTSSVANCGSCHTYGPDGPDGNTLPDFPFTGTYAQRGPHGAYSATSDRCSMCHTLHDAPTANQLLPGATISATCFTCHDGTAGFGVYGTIKARTGSDAPGGHRVDTTNVIPGGSATDGGATTGAFGGVGGTLSCDDCHSPHDSNTVAAFTGERIRLRAYPIQTVYSNRLLKKRPTGSTTSTDVYGSDWCSGCHAGRDSGGAVHNHPVESSTYYYNYLPVNNAPDTTAYSSGVVQASPGVIMGGIGSLDLGGSVRHPTPVDPTVGRRVYTSPWLMVYPRDALQVGYGPICQQCHEDARDCGYLSADGTVAWVLGDRMDPADADGKNAQNSQFDPANPKFQNFPHETQNDSLLVETGDNLCLNCHPTGQLP